MFYNTIENMAKMLQDKRVLFFAQIEPDCGYVVINWLGKAYYSDENLPENQVLMIAANDLFNDPGSDPDSPDGGWVEYETYDIKDAVDMLEYQWNWMSKEDKEKWIEYEKHLNGDDKEEEEFDETGDT